MIGADDLWKPIIGQEGRYEVSSLGQIRNTASGRLLKPKKLPNGYLRVKLTRANGSRERYVHRLVAEAFCIRTQGCNVVNHIDNNKTNNSANNLEWTTQRGNVYYAMKQNRMNGFPMARPVVGLKDGIEYKFDSINDASRFIGRDHKTIERCISTGKQDKNGYIWKVA